VLPKKYKKEGVQVQGNYLLEKMQAKGLVYSVCVLFVGLEFSSAKLPLDAPRTMNLTKQVKEFKTLMEQYEQEEECELIYEVIPVKQKKAQEVHDMFKDSSNTRKRTIEDRNKEEGTKQSDSTKREKLSKNKDESTDSTIEKERNIGRNKKQSIEVTK